MAIPLCTFPKIAKHASSAGLRDDWVASEKIHGAQLVVACDGHEVAIGKRKAWLAHDEPFFGWQLLRRALEEKARAVHTALGQRGCIWIYGELFGGHYPHSQVAAVPGLVPVQTGIWYAPDLQYAVFDVAQQVESEALMALGHEQAEQLCTQSELLQVPVLGRGRRAELERLPVRYESRVPTLLGLPTIAENLAEGYVLKPAFACPLDARPCSKWKIPEFDEQRFDESVPFQPDARLSREDWWALAEHLVNPARVASARSKVGSDARAVLEEVVLDALVDLQNLFPRAFDELTPELETELTAHLEACARRQARA